MPSWLWRDATVMSRYATLGRARGAMERARRAVRGRVVSGEAVNDDGPD